MMTRLVLHARSRSRVIESRAWLRCSQFRWPGRRCRRRPVRSRLPRFESASRSGAITRGGVGLAAARAMRRFRLPADDGELARGKVTRCPRAWERNTSRIRSASCAFGVAQLRRFERPSVTPSDSTGAIGTKRFIGLVNEKAAVYSRTGNVPIVTGTLTGFTGAGAADSVFDPQIIWDGQTRRFYYAAADVVSATSNFVAVGFSKTATPGSFSATDWCQFVVNFGQ